VLKKSFWGDEQKILEPLMRFARSDMRDHIVSHKNDHGASYRRYGVLQWRIRLKINFCEIFSVVRFSTFATLSAMSGPSDRAILIEHCSPLPSIKVFSANVPPWRHVCPYWIDRAQTRPMWSGPLPRLAKVERGRQVFGCNEKLCRER